MLSILIPTYNRAPILADCLQRLPDIDCEVVVSDNASTDDTEAVGRQTKDERIRYIRRKAHGNAFENLLHAACAARGEVVTYLADDDSLLGEPLALLAGSMEADLGLSAIYTDTHAWDDANQRVMHNSFDLFGPTEFTPGEDGPIEFVNFVLEGNIQPEVGLWRRHHFLRALAPHARMLPFHVWAYRMFRRGRVRFDPTVFYREHRILKPELAPFRPETNNLMWASQYIGDEQRLGMERMCLMALHDAGLLTPEQDGVLRIQVRPKTEALDEQRGNMRRMIDQVLLLRTSLEVERACQRGDFIAAEELRSRQLLWGGYASQADLASDAQHIVVPAAQQALRAYGDCTDRPSLQEMVDTYKLAPNPIVLEAAHG